MANTLIEKALHQGRKSLNEIESKEVLKSAGISVTETRLANTKEEALSISNDIGFPVVMKIMSNDISHKTDAGGVALNLRNEQEVKTAYDNMINTTKENFANAIIDGVSVQQMISGGVEIIMGMSKDPQFGPMLMFGLGGVFVEVLKDVTFKIVPLTMKDAQDMIAEIKGRPLLKGFRGSEPVDESAISETIYKLSEFVKANPEIEELDINPLFAGKDGVIAVDARIVL